MPSLYGYEIEQFVHNLSGFAIQATECKYSIPVTRYDSLSYKVYFVPTCLVFTRPVTFCGDFYLLLSTTSWAFTV